MDFGPLYCETPVFFSGFPAEPINTLSNLVIIAFGIFAWWAVFRFSKRSGELHILSFFLIAVGMGSLMWHGLRTPWALALDVVPGLVFFLLFAYLWLRAVRGPLAGLLVVITFVTAQGLLIRFAAPSFSSWFVFTPFIAIVLACASAAIMYTFRISARAGWLGVWSIASALVAAVARAADLSVCAIVPFGVHFLWHIGLATAALLGIMLLIVIKHHQK